MAFGGVALESSIEFMKKLKEISLNDFVKAKHLNSFIWDVISSLVTLHSAVHLQLDLVCEIQ